MEHSRIGLFIKMWFWLHLVTLLGLILQPSTPAVILGRYSTTSALLVAVFAVLTPIVWFGTNWLARWIETVQLATWQYAAVFLTSLVITFGLWVFNRAFTDSYIVMRLYFTFVALTLAVWSLLHMPSFPGRLGFFLAVGMCLLLLIVASRFPGLLWTDEGYMTTVALGFIQEGRPVPLYLRPAELASFSLTYLGLGAWYSLFGVDISTGRLFTFSLGLASLAFVYGAIRRSYSASAAWPAIVLGALALLVTNYLRTDIGIVLCLSAAFYFFSVAHHTGQNWPHLLVGLLVGFSLDGHPNAYRFSLAFGVAYLVEYGLLVWQRRRFFIYWPLVYLTVGGALGVGAYFALYRILTPEAFMGRVQSSLVKFRPHLIAPLLFEQFHSALQYAPLLLGAAALGIIPSLRRGTPLQRLAVIVLLASAVIFAASYPFYRDYYLVHSLIPLALLAGGAFYAMERHLSHTIMSGVTIFVVVASLGVLIQRFQADNSQGFNQTFEVARRIRGIVPLQEVFVGVDPFYFQMYDYPSFVELNAAGWYAIQEGIDEREAWERIRPTSVAVVHGYPMPPTQPLLDYIADHALQRVYCWRTERVGDVVLYMETIPDGLTASAECEVIE